MSRVSIPSNIDVGNWKGAGVCLRMQNHTLFIHTTRAIAISECLRYVYGSCTRLRSVPSGSLDAAMRTLEFSLVPYRYYSYRLTPASAGLAHSRPIRYPAAARSPDTRSAQVGGGGRKHSTGYAPRLSWLHCWLGSSCLVQGAGGKNRGPCGHS